jgi:hypothetical protein
MPMPVSSTASLAKRDPFVVGSQGSFVKDSIHLFLGEGGILSLGSFHLLDQSFQFLEIGDRHRWIPPKLIKT